MHPERRLAVWGLGLLLGLPGLACDRAATFEPPAIEPPPLVVERGDLQDRLILTGEVDAADSIELQAPRTNEWNVAIRWMAEDGSIVKKGDRVVELDNTALLDRISERELAVIEAGIDLTAQQAKASVDAYEKRFEVQTQQTAVDKAKLDASVPDALLSRREARDFALALSKAEVAHETARGELQKIDDGGKLESKVKRIAYDKAVRAYEMVEQQLDSLVVTAPRDGMVVVGDLVWERRKLQVGDNVWPGITVARMPDLSRMVVDASLSDVDEGRIQSGMKTTCTVDAFPDQPITGTIRAVSPVAQEVGRKTTRRFFSVVVDLDDADETALRPGLSVRVEVVTRQAEGVLVAPRAGLSFEKEGTKARLADGTTPEVSIDFCNASACAVTSGLSEGDVLIRAKEAE